MPSPTEWSEKERREAADAWSGLVMSMGGQHSMVVRLANGDIVSTDNVSLELQMALNRSQRACAEARELLEYVSEWAGDENWSLNGRLRKIDSWLAANPEQEKVDGC